MSVDESKLHLPSYDDLAAEIAPLVLDFSPSGLHGLMCGYLCAGSENQGEAYITNLLREKKDVIGREAVLAIARMYSISQQQMSAFHFGFELLLPDENSPLIERAKAFSEWCVGFTQGLRMAGVDEARLDEQEAREVLRHLHEFAELDYEQLDVDEEDEKALMEVHEYARMAVFRLHSDLASAKPMQGDTDYTH